MSIPKGQMLNSLSALSMDLKRVALGLHNNSWQTAKRFEIEAQKRQQELGDYKENSYLYQLKCKIAQALELPNEDTRKAEDLLMYSILLQNYCTSK